MLFKDFDMSDFGRRFDDIDVSNYKFYIKS